MDLILPVITPIFFHAPAGTIVQREPRIPFHAHLVLSIRGWEQTVPPDVKDAQMTCTTISLVKVRVSVVLRAQFHIILYVWRTIYSKTPLREWIQALLEQPLANALVNIANGDQKLEHVYANLDMNGMI